MDIFQMRCFVTVAQLENVSHAAELLHLSQSSLSKSIARMETELGMPLFVRSGKRISMNAQGGRFLECCNAVIREYDVAAEEMREIYSGSARIKLGITGSGATMIRCVSDFSELHPEAEFELCSGIDSRERVDINDFDVLIYPAGPRYERFTGYAVGEERYYLAVNKKSPLAAKNSVGLADLTERSFVFMRMGKSVFEFPYGVCTALALPFGGQCFTDSREMHRRVIASGMAAGFISGGLLESYRRDPGIRVVPINDPRFSREIMLCFRREKHLSPIAREFRDFVMERYKLA